VDLKPLPGDNLTARETLDVDQAIFINAFAIARNPYGDQAKSAIRITGNASLKGYTNKAWITNTNMVAIEGFDEVQGDFIYRFDLYPAEPL
jgi:hypothetical protein